MTWKTLIPAERKTFYFIGVTTARSSIMQVFPKWAEYLGLGNIPIRGIDCKLHDEPEVYRTVVKFIKDDPKSLGGLVTTHKIDLLKACRDLFEGLGPYAQRLEEISCISKRGTELWGHAKDPITGGLALESFIPRDHWRDSGADLCLLGAGGASLALTMYVMENIPPSEGPHRIVVTNRSRQRLEEMRKIHSDMNTGYTVEYHLCPGAEENDAVVETLVPGSLVVNATGLGKDAPGSPITDDVVLPDRGFIWEFNYRGDLQFLQQAETQRARRNLTIEDGWTYFIHGWTRVIAEVFHIEIPTSGPRFDTLSDIAAATRK